MSHKNLCRQAEIIIFQRVTIWRQWRQLVRLTQNTSFVSVSSFETRKDRLFSLFLKIIDKGLKGIGGGGVGQFCVGFVMVESSQVAGSESNVIGINGMMEPHLLVECAVRVVGEYVESMGYRVCVA